MEKIDHPPKLKKLLDGFSSGLKALYQEGLISLILYGSAASGEFKPGFSNINLLVVLNDTGLENLSKSVPLLKKSAFRNLNCLFFTPEYIAGSADVFPIEFLDMKENYLVIYGKDLLAPLAIDLKNLRFQCEQELKAKLLSIKSFYLFNRDKAALQNLLVRSFTSFLHISRNLIRLKGKSPAYKKEEILNDLAQEFKIDVSGVKKIFDLKSRALKLNYKDTESLLFDFVRKIEAITKAVDES
jgi:predicted nucleotidyltransferase